MNKYQEALNYLIENIEMLNRHSDGSFCQPYSSKNTLQELVDKATPKKPIKNKMRQGKTSSIDKLFELKDTYTCPNCGNALLEHYMNESQETRHCWDCGQALDWRVENVK